MPLLRYTPPTPTTSLNLNLVLHLIESVGKSEGGRETRPGGSVHISQYISNPFTAMVENVLAKLTKRESVPSHSLLISSMSTNNGGLGIQHPCSTAIPAFVLSTRRVIQYATNGIWISNTLPPVQLPGSITCLYNEWKTSSATTFEYFRRYATDISEICVQDNSVDPFDTFMSTTSVDTCHERIRAAAADRHKQLIEQDWDDKPESLHQLEDILEPRHSFALVDMSRLKPKNRQKNEHFGIMLCRKLRLALWPGERSPICFCGKTMDLFGDHVLSCRYHCKTAMSNATRNGLADISKRIYSLVHLTRVPMLALTLRRGVLSRLSLTYAHLTFRYSLIRYVVRLRGVHPFFSLDLM